MALDLSMILYGSKRIDVEPQIKYKIALKIANSIHYLHSQVKTIHRDIKSLNILINDNFEVKLSDFGLSRKKKRL